MGVVEFVCPMLEPAFLFTFFFAHIVLCALFLQGYAEGSHYNEHEGLSSPFISSGVAGMLSFWLSLANF